MRHLPRLPQPADRRGYRRRSRLTGTAAMGVLIAGLVAAPAGGAEVPDTRAAEGVEQIVNGDFSAGTAPWWWTANSPAAVTDGELCADIAGGTANPWDAIIGQDGVDLLAGEGYVLSFTAHATAPVAIRTALQMAVEPYTAEHLSTDRITTEPQTFTHTFTAKADNDAAQLGFQTGGHDQAFTLCLDDVSLTGGTATPPYEPDTGSPVRVNQVGYLTGGPKSGTFVTEAAEPLTWTLNAPAGTAAATGTTKVFGQDPTSRQHVHTFDFSEFTRAGQGYTVTIDGETSEPFAIGDDLYAQLRTDALAYFYHNRSGIEIDAGLVGEEYARPAGHLNTAPNQGDGDVPCQPGVCDYRLDVRGGWYDAGDHGKYVVNGGISAAQVMATYERTLTAENADGEPLGDGRLRVPERGNGTPDILDEAAWQLDFLMKMQVPAGEELAGMAHHKVHDEKWTGLPLLPHQDPEKRELHPPSTAATLNLAATGAQCARLFRPYDAAFADRCLTSATRAWQAALAHPEVYADAGDNVGGGAYEDADVRDEFYWAAAELFVTTGQDDYRRHLLDSPLHGDADKTFPRGGVWWGGTAGLGALSLATVDNRLTAAELAAVRSTVTTGADRYAADARAAAYGVPYAPEDSRYVWGSNSGVLNNMVVLGVAHDLTGDTKYRDALLGGLDYLLGRNPLNQSYVTGHGERDSRNQHHRHWAHQLDPNLPNPAPGSVAGGPNADIQDPVAQDKLQGCAPAMCYIDDIGSWATNEVTVNWNAPLAWIASYVDDLGGSGTTDPDPATCEVGYASDRWNGGFTSRVTVTNTGTEAIGPWKLTWSFADDQRVTHHWSSRITQAGRDVTAHPASWNGTIAPGGSVDFGFNGTSGAGAVDPTAFTLNGASCSTG